MPVDPAFFNAEAREFGLTRWPDQGELIIWRARGKGEWAVAEVELVWVGIEVMINLSTSEPGRFPSCCPALGDEFALAGDGGWFHARTGELVVP